MLNAIDTFVKWATVVCLVFIFLMMAGYIGLDLFSQYVSDNYIVIPKN